MNQENSYTYGSSPNNSEGVGIAPNDAENFRSHPNASEPFRNVPQHAEDLGSILQMSERKPNHTLTVRMVARMFEEARVPRTERSIINWCQPNKLGVARLDSYFDPNDRKYFISQESVERAIQEEKDKAQRNTTASQPASEEPIQKHSETMMPKTDRTEQLSDDEPKPLKQELMDLKITNRAKDMFIEQLQKERESLVQQLVLTSKTVGELETKLLQLHDPNIPR